ncbi:putative leucine-rich repeat domain superfamily [Helianthus annuus]|nr:putative leucine-rich repeat domain superfamily [Helianthus annuus]
MQNWLASSESASLGSTGLEQLPWSFHNLIELYMERSFDMEVKSIIPSNELLQLQKLKGIQLKTCKYVEEIFDEPQSDVEIPNLTQVELKDLLTLKYIWKSNHHVLEFPNLTTLSIDNCCSLEHVLTSSMVGSLQQLQHLHIHDCPKMEVIVKVEEEKEEIECDAEVKEIVLPRLKSLKLNKLKSLQGFCLGKVDFSWPSLHTLEITGCPKITVFSKGLVATPNLNIIDTSFGRCYLTEDINSFIKTKQDEGFSLGEYLFYSSEDESE